MCGIIGVISRPPTREAPSHDEILGRLDRASPRSVTRRPSPPRSPPSTSPCTACRACSPWPTATTSSPGSRPARPARRVRRRGRPRPRAERPEPTSSSGATPRRSPCATCCGRSVATASAPPARSPLWPAGRRSARAGYLAIQQAFSAIDRMEVRGRDSAGLHVFVWNHGLDLADPWSRPRSPPARRPAVPVRLGATGRRRACRFVYKAAAEIGELGDNTAACGPRSRRRPAPPGPVARRRHGARCSATPGGPASASSPSPTPTRSTATRSSSAGAGRARTWSAALNGDVDNHADLKVAHGSASPADHHRRQGDPGAASAGTPWPACDLVEAFRRTVSAFEGSVAIGAAAAGDPDTGAAGPARQRPGPVRRSRRRPLHRRQRALRHGRGDRPLRPPRRRARRWQIVVLDANRAGKLDGIRRLAYDGTTSPVDATERRHRRGHHPRHRPRRRPALPAEGDQRGARELRPRRCAARSSSPTAGCARSSATGRCRRRRRATRRRHDHARPRHRPGHGRRGRPERWPRCSPS